MIDWLGRWTEEQDYSVYPEGEWCDLDHVANWIRTQGYTPKIDMETLAERIISMFAEEDESNNDFRPVYKENLMINVEMLAEYVKACGGIQEFDYEA